MWINRAEYENLKSAAEENERDAKMFRNLIKYIEEKKTAVYHADFILISRDKWDELINRFSSKDDKVRDLRAELEWYKVKYHEIKTNNGIKDSENQFVICHICSSYGWDMPECKECNCANSYKYFKRKIL